MIAYRYFSVRRLFHQRNHGPCAIVSIFLLHAVLGIWTMIRVLGVQDHRVQQSSWWYHVRRMRCVIGWHRSTTKLRYRGARRGGYAQLRPRPETRKVAKWRGYKAILFPPFRSDRLDSRLVFVEPYRHSTHSTIHSPSHRVSVQPTRPSVRLNMRLPLFTLALVAIISNFNTAALPSACVKKPSSPTHISHH